MEARRAVARRGLLLAAAPLVAVVLLASGAAALEMTACPERAAFNGCMRNSCVLLPDTRRNEGTVVCSRCGPGHVLVHAGTRRAGCECAPGFAAKGNEKVCRKCPESTEIALGGSLLTSACLNCPPGTFVNAEGTDCLCPAGRFKALEASPAPGLKGVSCTMCAGRAEFIAEDRHSQRACRACTPPLVANANHTACVADDAPDAAPEVGLGGAIGVAAVDPLKKIGQLFTDRVVAPITSLFQGGGGGGGGSGGGAAGARATADGGKKAEEEAQEKQAYESSSFVKPPPKEAASSTAAPGVDAAAAGRAAASRARTAARAAASASSTGAAAGSTTSSSSSSGGSGGPAARSSRSTAAAQQEQQQEQPQQQLPAQLPHTVQPSRSDEREFERQARAREIRSRDRGL